MLCAARALRSCIARIGMASGSSMAPMSSRPCLLRSFFLPKASLGTSKTENKSVKMNMFCGLVMFSWRLKQSQIYSFPDYRLMEKH